MDQGINALNKLILPEHEHIRYKISQQVTDGNYEIPTFLKRDDIKISQINTIGLSKNRNNCLKMIENDIAIIADDDVSFNLLNLLSIIDDYKLHNNIDFITYMIDTNSNKVYRNYPKSVTEHTKFTISKVSSIEITFRANSINEIKFNENFGLGSSVFPSGEENLFLLDFLNSNKKGLFIPKFLVNHEFESSGKNQIYDTNKAFFTAVKFNKIYKKTSIFFIFYHILKYNKKYRELDVSIFKLIKIMIFNKDIKQWI